MTSVRWVPSGPVAVSRRRTTTRAPMTSEAGSDQREMGSDGGVVLAMGGGHRFSEWGVLDRVSGVW